MIPPYEAIRNLLGTYSLLLDEGDFDGLGRMFTRAVLLDDRGREAATGAESATALWTALIRRYDGSPRTRHVIAGPVIEVTGATAVARSTFLVLQQTGAGRLEPICAGRYRDEFACTDGVWHFTSRQFFLDQAGDMSKHMVSE